MGHYSHYCGFSRITITEGTRAFLLPLHKNNYGRFSPVCAPIEGVYDGYGRMEGIVPSPTTALLETYSGTGIETFAENLGRKGVDDTGEMLYGMWLHGDIWDALRTEHNYRDVFGYSGRVGDISLLQYVGFKYLEKEEAGRYNHVLEYAGTRFRSDGRWFQTAEGRPVYSFTGEGNSLEALGLPITPEMVDFESRPYWKSFSLFSEKAQEEIVNDGFTHGTSFNIIASKLKYAKLFDKLGIADEDGEDEAFPELVALITAQLQDLNVYGDGLTDIFTLKFLCNRMSIVIEPMVPYITPPDGEFGLHNTMLELFKRINDKEIVIRKE
jgi:hypothetical protein